MKKEGISIHIDINETGYLTLVHTVKTRLRNFSITKTVRGKGDGTTDHYIVYCQISLCRK